MNDSCDEYGWRSILEREWHGEYSVRLYRIFYLIWTKKIRWSVVAILSVYTLILGWLGLARNEDIVPYLPTALKNDKILHFVAFAVFSILLYAVWIEACVWVKSLVTGTIMFILSFSSEIIQSLSPYRHFDMQDILPDLIGSTLGLVLSAGFNLLLNRFWRHSYMMLPIESQLQDEDISLDELA